jgi:hypothetical protein
MQSLASVFALVAQEHDRHIGDVLTAQPAAAQLPFSFLIR